MHKIKIKKLRETVTTLDITAMAADTELFIGADILVSDDPQSPESNGWNVYNRVITPHAKELSWLLMQLKAIFSRELDYMNKYYFYGELADAAKASISAGHDETTEILTAVLDKAAKIEL